MAQSDQQASPYEAITGEGALRKKIAQVRALLQGVPLFADFEDRQMDELAQLATVSEAPAGKVLMREGDAGDQLIIIISGEARVERSNQPIRTLGPGAHLGEISLIDGKPRSATIIAESPVSMVVVGRPAFEHFLNSAPDMRDRLLVTLCQRIRTYGDLLV